MVPDAEAAREDLTDDVIAIKADAWPRHDHGNDGLDPVRVVDSENRCLGDALVLESAPSHLKAPYGAFTPMGSTGGFALAAAVAGIVSGLTADPQMESWGWRIPFLLTFPLTLFCLWARTRVEETHQVEEADEVPHSPIMEIFRKQPKSLVQATAISAATNGTAYIGLTYLSIHLIQRLGYESTPVYWIATIAIGISALLMPLGELIGYIVLTYPKMGLMDNGLLIAAIAYLVIMLNTVATQVSAYTLLPLLFKKELRYTGVAMGWNLGVVIAGSTAPFFAVWLIERTGNVLAPAFFVIVIAVVGLIAIVSVKDKLDHSFGKR